MNTLDARANNPDMDIFEYFQDNIAKAETVNEERTLAVFMQAIAKEPGLISPSMKAMYDAGYQYVVKLIQNSKKKGVVRTDIDEELLIDYFLAVTERFDMRWLERYIDFSAESTEEQNRALHQELTQMMELLKNGMGC